MKNKTGIWWLFIGIGACWALLETLLGMFMRDTELYFITGSLLTGLTVLFFAFGYSIAKNPVYLFISLITVIAFKLYDAALLHLPVVHGAVGNPIYAMVVEVLAFLIIVAILREKMFKRNSLLAVSGIFYALIAVVIFPFVKFFTGVPPCVVVGTNYPLSLSFSFVAMFVSAVCLPLGMNLGAIVSKYYAIEDSLELIMNKKLIMGLQGLTTIILLSILLIRL